MQKMKRQVITSKVPSAPGLLSQAIVSDGFVFVSGLTNAKLPGWILVEGSVENRLKVVMKNIEKVLKAAGADLDDIVKVTLYVTDIKMLPEINKVYGGYFKAPLPAREVIEVRALPLGASIEMSVIAKRPKK